MLHWERLLGLFLVFSSLAACTTTSVKSAKDAPIHWQAQRKQVVLIEPDIMLGELSAGGVFEPRADWTKNAKTFVNQEVGRVLGEKGISLATVDTLSDPKDYQIAKLHSAVGNAILLHLYSTGLRLPNKGKALDWTLGPGTGRIADRYGADYGLFLFVRDSYTSAGRALMMVGAAVLGVGIGGGQQVGFASLVDLHSGNIVWFNLLLSATGDLRTEQPARDVVHNLLDKLPL